MMVWEKIWLFPCEMLLRGAGESMEAQRLELAKTERERSIAGWRGKASAWLSRGALVQFPTDLRTVWSPDADLHSAACKRPSFPQRWGERRDVKTRWYHVFEWPIQLPDGVSYRSSMVQLPSQSLHLGLHQAHHPIGTVNIFTHHPDQLIRRNAEVRNLQRLCISRLVDYEIYPPPSFSETFCCLFLFSTF